jgi:ATP adenylyltransferase
VLNLYPYATGHLLVVPYAHLPDLDAIEKATSDEMMDLSKRCQTILRKVYRPDGFNLGINLGTVAGAGVVNHLHIHVLPRWAGDTNFMTTVGDTRVMPEDLRTTFQKLRTQF